MVSRACAATHKKGHSIRVRNDIVTTLLRQLIEIYIAGEKNRAGFATELENEIEWN